MSNEQSGLWDRAFNAWWGKVLMGLLVVGGAMLLYTRLAALEAGEVDHMRVSRFVKVAYDFGGKYTVSGLIALGGVGLAGWGVVQVIRGKE